MPDIRSILDPAPIPKGVKADAFDAYTSATSADDLQQRLDKLPPIPQKVKADLWDAKNAEGAAVTPAKPAESGGGFWNGVGNFLGGVVETVNPLPAIQRYAVQPALDVAKAIHDGDAAGLASAVGRLNPANTMASDIGNAQLSQGQQAVDLARQGRYTEAAGHAGAAVLPVLGPAAAQAGETIAGGETARGLGQAAGLVGSVLAPHAIAPLQRAVAPLVAQAAPAVESAVNKIANLNPRPLSPGAAEMAQSLDVPLTRGMQSGSRTIQATEKLLGHSVASDLYEPLMQQAQEGVNTGAQKLAGDFAVDKYTAGDNTIKAMLDAAKGHETAAQTEYDNLRDAESDPKNTRVVQVGTKANASADPAAPDRVPDMQPVALPTDMRPVKQAIAPFVEEIQRRMTPAQRNTDPGLSALQNILSRPDALPASVAEADLGYLKEIQRSEATPQAKRLATIAANALQPAIDSAVSIAGPDAVGSLQTARGSWAARSSILDDVKSLANDTTGRTGQVLLANKLLQPSDASFPALERVLNDAPGAAQDLGKAFLTERVFQKAAQAGADFTNPTQAQNSWNQIGPRTKAALYTPQQIEDMNNFLELAKRVAENPNPSGTGTLNMLIKMGVLLTHPVQGAAAFVLGRGAANLLYYPKAMENLATALASPHSPAGIQAASAVKSITARVPTAFPGVLPVVAAGQTQQTGQPTQLPAAGTR